MGTHGMLAGEPGSPFVVGDVGYVLTEGRATVCRERKGFFTRRAVELAVGEAIEPRVPSVATVTRRDGSIEVVRLEPERAVRLDLVSLTVAILLGGYGRLALVAVPILLVVLALVGTVRPDGVFADASLERMAIGIGELADEERDGFRRREHGFDPAVRETIRRLAAERGDGT